MNGKHEPLPVRERPSEQSDQAAAVAFMLDSATHGGAPVQHIETHVSHVFLAGDLAYKMKKAVKFEFADFRTLQRRRRTCADEIFVNARTAPEIYLDVVAINAGEDGLSLGPPGRAIEYLVRMRRFSQADLFDRMADEARLDEACIRALADAVARLHRSAARVPIDRLAEDFEVTATQLSDRLVATPATGETASLVAQWRRLMQRELTARLPEIRARARHGAVRHGHGDLHLRNICLFEGKVLLFDAIEFEPKFSHVDTLYDLAFPVMDLLHRARSDLATLLLSRYLTSTRDYAGAGLLRLFISVRAGVRALVNLLGPDPCREGEARSYLALAIRALERPPAPRLVAIGGRSGTGKSTIARLISARLAESPDVVIIRSDEVRKHLLGVPAETRLGQSAYSPETTERVYNRMFADARRVVRAGGQVILDATFLDARSRTGILDLGQRLGIPVHGFWLKADTDTLASRLDSRRNDASDADRDVLQKQAEPDALLSWQQISADGPPPAVANTIWRRLSGR